MQNGLRLGGDFDSGPADANYGRSYEFLEFKASEVFAVDFALGDDDFFVNVFQTAGLGVLLYFPDFVIRIVRCLCREGNTAAALAVQGLLYQNESQNRTDHTKWI